MIWKLSHSRRPASSRRTCTRRGFCFETLENRVLMAGDLSISDAIAVEGSTRGRFLDVFAADASSLMWPADITFGPDGNLYVLGRESSNVVRFNGVTGDFVDEFVPARSAGLLHPNYLSFGPDGNVYVASLTTSGDTVNRILRFDGVTAHPCPPPVRQELNS